MINAVQNKRNDNYSNQEAICKIKHTEQVKISAFIYKHTAITTLNREVSTTKSNLLKKTYIDCPNPSISTKNIPSLKYNIDYRYIKLFVVYF